MKKSKILLVIGIIFAVILLGIGLTFAFLLKDKESINTLSVVTPQNISFKIQEQDQGQTPSQKLDAILNAIKEKNVKTYEELYSVVGLGHIGLYEGINSVNIGKADQNALQQRENIKNILFSKDITDYQILSSKFYNQPCCSVGWVEYTDLSWIGMARYNVKFTFSDGTSGNYNIEITVSNPDWLMPGEQVEMRKWVITNISDKDLPELYKGF